MSSTREELALMAPAAAAVCARNRDNGSEAADGAPTAEARRRRGEASPGEGDQELEPPPEAAEPATGVIMRGQQSLFSFISPPP
jgi:hypothetical protein